MMPPAPPLEPPPPPAARPGSRRSWLAALCGALCLPALGQAAQAQTQEADSRGTRIVALAEQLAQAHVPYRSGGSSRGGLDCSGLVWYLHHQIGVTVPRRASEQSAAAQPVTAADLRPGDLLFFRLHGSRRINHVGIYIAPGELIHASLRRRSVTWARLDDRYFAPRVAAAGRLWDAGKRPAAPGMTVAAAPQGGDPTTLLF